MKTVIIIPARYASTRLPGKPLMMIAGKTMLQRVVEIANAAASGIDDVRVVVATDDDRITAHCRDIGANYIMTSPDCPSGTDRAAEVVRKLEEKPDFVVNMQGDAPLTPPDFLRAMIDSFRDDPCDMVTPVVQLTWSELDQLRTAKTLTPFSGTTAVFERETQRALWFSKNIVPAIRKEKELREIGELSPVYRHIGIYGYATLMLERYLNLPEGVYERLEGLEQLRALENGYIIRCVPVDYQGRANMSGVDSPEDVGRAEALIAQHGELLA